MKRRFSALRYAARRDASGLAKDVALHEVISRPSGPINFTSFSSKNHVSTCPSTVNLRPQYMPARKSSVSRICSSADSVGRSSRRASAARMVGASTWAIQGYPEYRNNIFLFGVRGTKVDHPGPRSAKLPTPHTSPRRKKLLFFSSSPLPDGCRYLYWIRLGEIPETSLRSSFWQRDHILR